jgi:hypothetical protein
VCFSLAIFCAVMVAGPFVFAFFFPPFFPFFGVLWSGGLFGYPGCLLGGVFGGGSCGCFFGGEAFGYTDGFATLGSGGPFG